jgi:hypothetical protein
MRTEVKIIKTSNIEGLNKVNNVLRHFVELSAKLLPFLNEINTKEHPIAQEILDREKILDVYRRYKFDTNTSRTLMDSEILYLIKKAYLRLSEYEVNPLELIEFQEEYARLAKNWLKIDAN